MPTTAEPLTVSNYRKVCGNLKSRFTKQINKASLSLQGKSGTDPELTSIEVNNLINDILEFYEDSKTLLNFYIESANSELKMHSEFYQYMKDTSKTVDDQIETFYNEVKQTSDNLKLIAVKLPTQFLIPLRLSRAEDDLDLDLSVDYLDAVSTVKLVETDKISTINPTHITSPVDLAITVAALASTVGRMSDVIKEDRRKAATERDEDHRRIDQLVTLVTGISKTTFSREQEPAIIVTAGQGITDRITHLPFRVNPSMSSERSGTITDQNPYQPLDPHSVLERRKTHVSHSKEDWLYDGKSTQIYDKKGDMWVPVSRETFNDRDTCVSDRDIDQDDHRVPRKNTRFREEVEQNHLDSETDEQKFLGLMKNMFSDMASQIGDKMVSAIREMNDSKSMNNGSKSSDRLATGKANQRMQDLRTDSDISESYTTRGKKDNSEDGEKLFIPRGRRSNMPAPFSYPQYHPEYRDYRTEDTFPQVNGPFMTGGKGDGDRPPPKYPPHSGYNHPPESERKPSATHKDFEMGRILADKMEDWSARQLLPALQITKFDGKLEKWLNFYLDFEDFVSRRSFSEHEKYAYLCNFLEGSPRKLVQGYRGNPNEFRDAWNNLEYYYGDPRALAGNISKKLKFGPPVKGDREMLHFHQELVSDLRTLKRFRQSELIENWEAIGHIASRLPIDFQRKWRREVRRIRDRGIGCQEKLDDFLHLLGDEARALNIPFCTGQLPGSEERNRPRTSTNKTTKSDQFSFRKLIPRDKRVTFTTVQSDSASESLSASDSSLSANNFDRVVTAVTRQVNKTLDNKLKYENSGHKKIIKQRLCPMCNNGHVTMLKCKAYTSLPLETRRNLARSLNFCYKCLSYQHVVKQCQSVKACSKCDKQHHETLHKDFSLIELKQNKTNQISHDATGTVLAPHSTSSASKTNKIAQKKKTVKVVSMENESEHTDTSVESEEDIHSSSWLESETDATFKISTHTTANSYMKSFRVIPLKVIGNKASEVLYAVLDNASTTSYIDIEVAKKLGSVGKIRQHTISMLNGEQEVDVGIFNCELDAPSPELSGEPESLPVTSIQLKAINGLADSFEHPMPWNTKEEEYFVRTLGVPRVEVHGNQQISVLLGLDIFEAHHIFAYKPEKPKMLQMCAVQTVFGWYRRAPMRSVYNRLIRTLDNATFDQLQEKENPEIDFVTECTNTVVDFDTCVDIYERVNNSLMTTNLQDIYNDPQLWLKLDPIIQDHLCQIACQDKAMYEMVNKYFIKDTPESGSWNSTPGVEEKRAKEILETTTKRLPNGHYQTGMLWKNDTPRLPNNRTVAYRQAMAQRKKLLKNEVLHRHYCTQIDDYREKGYLVPIDNPKESTDRTNYLPHHSVTHPDKPGKVRVVNNASSKFKGKSLNDELLSGPNVINSLLGIILRFREHRFAWNCDIEAMFHQVFVPPQDREALRFLWWPDSEMRGEPIEYNFTVHVFGKLDSPCVAINAVNQTGRDFSHDYIKEVLITILRDFYVDDCLRSGDYLDTEKTISTQLIDCLSKGGFNLNKFCSNSKELLQSIPRELRVAPDNEFIRELIPESKSLGLGWNPNDDILYVRWKPWKTPQRWTKRLVLSLLASFYDPVGFISPVILLARLVFQQLWKLHYDWDDAITDVDILNQWQLWLDQIVTVKEMKIPRWYFSLVAESSKYQLHAFSDASEKAIGVTIYLRRQTPNGDVEVAFVMSKSKVIASKSYISMPRAELLAATVSSKITIEVQEMLTYKPQLFFWTDARLVLVYLNTKQNLKTYVANRCAQILDRSKSEQWFWCPGNENPADVASRGCGVQKLQENELWFAGPSFLRKSQENWPQQPKFSMKDEQQLELKVPKVKEIKGLANQSNYKREVFHHEGSMGVVTLLTVSLTRSIENKIFERLQSINTWSRAVRILAYCKKVAQNWLKKIRKPPELRQSRRLQKLDPQTIPTTKIWILSREEYHSAENCLLQWYQQHEHPEEYNAIQNGVDLPPKSSLNRYVIIMEDQLLKIHSRLQRSDSSHDFKNPILIPIGRIQEQMVLDQHIKNLHAGRALISTNLRRRFWLHKPSAAFNRILRNCVKCRLWNAPLLKQQMGQLPEDRLKAHETPFTRVGLDLWGPYNVKQHRTSVKRWGLIFTCLATRAVHLERVTHSNTPSFILALRRFTSRRGEVKDIYCDSAPNFHGACNEIGRWCNSWNQQQIADDLKQQQIIWHFNTPTAKWRGGIWEREIGTIKHSLTKIIPNTDKLTDDQFNTALIEIEGILNSRPLVVFTNDVNNPQAITPAHVLNTQPFIPVPREIENNESTLNSTVSWKKTQYVADKFWDNWSKHYLDKLSLGQKWNKAHRNVQVGDYVLLQRENIPRRHWVPAVVLSVKSDDHGLVRTVELKTITGSVYERPVQRLAILESTAIKSVEDD